MQCQTVSAVEERPHPPVNLDLRFINGQSHFHIGELIPVELVFSSSGHEKVGFGEDCMGHGTYKFQVVPDDFVDRALERTAAGFGEGRGMGCHGWPAEQKDLAKEPFIVNLDLNAWFRMETSGHYKISVTAWRTGFAVASRSVDIDILPRDPLWEKEELIRIASMMNTRANEKRPEGCKRLSYLETKDAELEMARLYQGFDYCDQMLYAPLINARNRKLVLDELETGIVQPDRPIRTGYLGMLAKVSLYQKHPDWYPATQPTDAQSDSRPNGPSGPRSGLWHTPGAIQSEELHYAELLASALPHKTGEALALSVKTLLELDETFMGGEVPAKFAVIARELVPKIFLDLPAADQEQLLQRDWSVINSPAMIPALKHMIEGNGMGPRGHALRRLAELSPADARPIILEELREPRSGYPPYSYRELSMLPDKELPEIDTILFDRVKKQLPSADVNLFESTALLARYASPSIEVELLSLVEGKIGTMWTPAEANILAYFLRVEPATGKKMLIQCITTQNESQSDILLRVAEIIQSKEIEQSALIALDNPSPGMLYGALTVLQRYGSVDSKEVLLDHFRNWSEKWKSGPNEFKTPESSDVEQVEREYMGVLTAPQMWLASPQEIEALERLCITKSCEERAAQLSISVKETHFEIDYRGPSFGEEPGDEFSVAQYGNIMGMEQLKQKLAQFPKGAAFTVKSTFGGYAKTQEVYNSLLPWAIEHGVELHVIQRKTDTMILGSMF
jgi:hypothetical protein